MYHTGAADKHLANTLGTLATELASQIAEATESVVGRRGEVPAAVNALAQFLDGATIQQLSDVLALTHSGAVRLVNRLEDHGLAARTPGPDGRSQSVQLTKAGRALGRRVAEARAGVVNDALADLDADDRQALAQLVDALVSTLTARRMEERRKGREPDGWLCRLCSLADCGRAAGKCPAASTAAAHLSVDG